MIKIFKTEKIVLCLSVIILLAGVRSTLAESNTIKFLCSWDGKELIAISIDQKAMIATRDDGGRTYTVAKITKFGVWLIVDDPKNLFGMAFQVIQRGEAVTPYKQLDAGKKYIAGNWIDISTSVSGQSFASPIVGGKCWEQKNQG